MSFTRKGLWIATGGLSGAAGVKANSKKERTAKALEKQNRLLEKFAKESEPASPPLASLADELTKFVALRGQGVIGDEEFETIKKRLVGQVMEPVDEAHEPGTWKRCVKCGTEVERWPDWKWKLCEPCLGERRAKKGAKPVEERKPEGPRDDPPKGFVDKTKALQAQLMATREADLANLKDAGVRRPQRELNRQHNRKVLLEPLGLRPGKTKWQKKQEAVVTRQRERAEELPPAQWASDPTGESDLRYWDGQQWTDYVSTAVHPLSEPLNLPSAPRLPPEGFSAF